VRFYLTNHWRSQVPEGLDPCLPADVLKVFQLATQGVRVTPESITSASVDPLELAALWDDDPTAEGSNNWVVAPTRSTTGRAIMANDPHRAYSAPSLRYIAHISAPGLNVIGAGEPALPGISIGHNGTIAFGLTIFNIDQEDLYVYELNSNNLTQYRYKGGWESFRVVKEEIRVKDGAAQSEARKRIHPQSITLLCEPMNKEKELFKGILLFPGTVFILIPAIILQVSGPIRWFCGKTFPESMVVVAVTFFLACVGISIALWTVMLFYNLGNGTPVPWAPPKHLIVKGPYAYVRNPMIVAVIAILLAETLLFGSIGILVWVGVLWGLSTLYITLIEESGLKDRFGDEYVEYSKNVARWVPRMTPWFPTRSSDRF